MINWLKKLFCRHSWRFIGELEFVTTKGEWVEEIHRCTKCDRRRQRLVK